MWLLYVATYFIQKYNKNKWRNKKMDFIDVFTIFTTVFYIAVGIYVVRCFENDRGKNWK